MTVLIAVFASPRNITDTARSPFRTPRILHNDSKAGAVRETFKGDSSIVGVRMSAYRLQRVSYGFHTIPGFAETSDHICTTLVQLYDMQFEHREFFEPFDIAMCVFLD